jgi:hypothetical protein
MFLATARAADLAPLAPADLVVSPRPIWAIMAGPIRSRSSRRSGRRSHAI